MELALVAAEQARGQCTFRRDVAKQHSLKWPPVNARLGDLLDLLADNEGAPLRQHTQRQRQDFALGVAARQQSFEMLDGILMRDAHVMNP